MAFSDLHYKYVNPIRKKDGTLREWDDYDFLSRLENSQDQSAGHYTFWQERERQEWKHKLLEKENEKNP